MGWTFAEIGEHTLHDVTELMRYWERYPPAHIAVKNLNGMVGALAGVKSQVAIRPSDSDLIATANSLNGGPR